MPYQVTDIDTLAALGSRGNTGELSDYEAIEAGLNKMEAAGATLAHVIPHGPMTPVRFIFHTDVS